MTAVNSALSALGDMLARDLGALSGAMSAMMIDHIPELRGDQQLVDALETSVHGNLSALSGLFRHNLDPNGIPTPAGATLYARLLAQHGISVTALVRAYRLGHRDLISWALDRWEEESGEASFEIVSELMDRSSGYIDSISERVIAEYSTERDKWLAHRDRARVELLNRVMAEDEIDLSVAEQTLRYRFRQNHLGLVLWSDQHRTEDPSAGTFETLGSQIAEALGTGPGLLWPQDATTAWMWLPLGQQERAHSLAGRSRKLHLTLADVLGDRTGRGTGLRAAVGPVAGGVDGFRLTLRQARRAQRVAQVPKSPNRTVVMYDDTGVRAASLLVNDLAETRRLVTATLGGLAENSERADRLRDTVLTLIEENGSLTRASERLHVHKNTVKYRLRQAAELRGRPISEDRWDLELALHGCRHLGVLGRDVGYRPVMIRRSLPG